ncbi:carbonic anhydrase family protein [Paraflavitalea sp. CAU 1676]|uniref:carbonic anhydrase family protein n=1 Tax=Paraflavitalea sp. CAU 1676 TaxID=3032598 RepID=UPI0023DA7188|nr:carbonic anhydrase family protein [Paraflavitalea sp. CAU 1676]MDF2193291.1 carbonic anhydrase family protein [Paraflavitalea sp. CAU 1676]
MTNSFHAGLLAITATCLLLSCRDAANTPNTATTTTTTASDSAQPTVQVIPRRERVLTAEEQKALTPDQVLENLKAGNQRFVRNDVTARDHSAMVRNASPAQYPKAVILSCLDSRVPVEDVFDKGIGDLFVARVAGNFVNEDILGSMEYGCKVSGAKLILVLGHESCGAIKAAIDNVKLGNITAMLTKIKPAVAKSQDFNGEKSAGNAAFVEHVAKNNVINTINEIMAKSPILKEMADKGEIKIAGAYYDLKTGEVVFL